jgi:hypothetical protein
MVEEKDLDEAAAGKAMRSRMEVEGWAKGGQATGGWRNAKKVRKRQRKAAVWSSSLLTGRNGRMQDDGKRPWRCD